MSAERILTLIEHTRKDLDLLEANVRRAASVQWERPTSRRTSASDIKARGGHRDPTGDTAVDPVRLSVRRSIVRTDTEMVKVARTVRGLAGLVGHAVGTWEKG
jgi:hypothetical protein